MMKKEIHTVGILNATQSSRSGGGFHYIVTLITGLVNESDLNVIVFYDDPAFPRFCPPSQRLLLVRLEGSESSLTKAVRGISTFAGIRSSSLGRFRVILEHDVDLLISFDSLIGYHLGIPFLSFVGDVMYKYYPSLPEYSWRIRMGRDLSVRMLLRHAEFTVVDSEESKKDLVRFFKAPAVKLKPIPLCAPPHIYKYARDTEVSHVNVSVKYHLPERFIFYPAQFWSHKNHANLIRALALIRQRENVEIPAVFVGSAQESFQNIQKLVRDLGMESQVRFLGYLADEEIVALYRKADALVFASFADYTSIPLVEAMVLGTPIICSNVFSLPEQVGDAGMYFDPSNVQEIADVVYRVWTDENLRKTLAANGLKRRKQFSLENFANQWRVLIESTLERPSK
jgi:glycosyltransferase involved in cell wall biosynthesis